MIARLLFIENKPSQQESTFLLFSRISPPRPEPVEVESEFLSDEKLQSNDPNISGLLFF